MLCSILLGVAEMEQETRKERQAAGIEAARERGVYLGRKEGTTKAAPERALELSARGLNHKEIATALGVSRRTVIRYLKLGQTLRLKTPPPSFDRVPCCSEWSLPAFPAK